MDFSNKSDACFGQINNHYCYSQVYNLDNNPLQCKRSSESCVRAKGSFIKTFIFQTIGTNPDLQDSSNIWTPCVQQNVELLGSCLSRTTQNSLFNTQESLSCSRLSSKRVSKITEQFNNSPFDVPKKNKKTEQRKQKPKTRNERSCYLFEPEVKSFAVIDEKEAIKELNNWQPRFEDTIEELPVEIEPEEIEVLEEQSVEDKEEGLEEYISQIIDEILSLVDKEVQKNELLRKSSDTSGCCCCHCGMPLEEYLYRRFKKKRFYCEECGLSNECVCTVLNEVSEYIPCGECGYLECICSVCDGSSTKSTCSSCGLRNCICSTFSEPREEESSKSSKELCLCGCYVVDCICCNLQLYLGRSSEKLELSSYSTHVEHAGDIYSCGCNIQGCVCLRFQSDGHESICSPSCDLIDCTCKMLTSPVTMMICPDASDETDKEQPAIEKKYDCKRFVSYFIKTQRNKLRYLLEKNQNFIYNQNGNYCAICGYFNCPCRVPNIPSSTTIYEM